MCENPNNQKPVLTKVGKGAFQMSKKSRQEYSKIIRRRKQKIERRLERKQWEDQERPMFHGRNIHYEAAEKSQAISCGGIGAIHQMVQRCGLVEEINTKLKLLKVHVPYHESDHVLNIAYNILAGGMRVEDIELNRNNEGYLNAVGAQRIPDPTTGVILRGGLRRKISGISWRA